MDTASPASSNIGGLMRTITKIVRFRRASGGAAGGNGVAPEEESIQKVKFRDYFEGSTILPQPVDSEDDEKKLLQQKQLHEREATEALLAKLFASISAIKASYAQLQIAQAPYDPDTIQSADQAVVSELKHLSQLKQSFFKKQTEGHDPSNQESSQDSQMLAEIQEQRNLLKTFQITARKLESDMQAKDSEVVLLRDQLFDSEKQSRSLEARLHPNRSLSVLDDLHLSGLNPTHFLTVVRYTVKSIRSFVKLMVQLMESSRWDLNAAAASIEPDVAHGQPEHRAFAFQSYVCLKILSHFQHRSFGFSDLGNCSSWNQRQFFDQFVELKSAKPKQLLDWNADTLFGKFCRAKYLTLVHPKMEATLCGNTDQRALLISGRGFPETAFFEGFVEMARRVWLLHCLFFSFGPEAKVSIFRVRRGSRFSDVFMESVVEDNAGDVRPTVGFTVVPGFMVGKTVIQCKVYLERRGRR